MQIEYIGHSCFLLQGSGYRLILDPYAAGTVPGLSPVAETADVVLCSHGHPDHCGVEHITVSGAAVPVKITAIPSYHDEVQGAKRGENTIHLIEDGITRVAHLGDLGCELTDQQAVQLQNLDVLMIPVGGFFTINAAQAAEIVEQLRPRVVIPMHYRQDSIGYDVIDTVTAFADRMDSVEQRSGSSMDTAEQYAHFVLILQPRNQEGTAER